MVIGTSKITFKINLIVSFHLIEYTVPMFDTTKIVNVFDIKLKYATIIIALYDLIC